MDAWFIHAGFAGTAPDDADEALLADALFTALPHGADVQPAAAPGGPGWRVRFTLEAGTLREAAAAGASILHRVAKTVGFRGVSVRWLEVLDEAEFDRREAQPVVPALVGLKEVADRLGVTKTRAAQIAAEGGRLREVGRTAAGPLYLERDLEVLAGTERRPGRPARALMA